MRTSQIPSLWQVAPLGFLTRAFVAEVPELPGCMAHGETQAAALANANDAM